MKRSLIFFVVFVSSSWTSCFAQTNLASIQLTGWIVVTNAPPGPTVYLSLLRNYGTLSGCELSPPSNSAAAWWWIAATNTNGPWTSVVNTGETAVVNGTNACVVVLSNLVGKAVSGVASGWVDGASTDSISIMMTGFGFQDSSGVTISQAGYSSYDGTNLNTCVLITTTNDYGAGGVTNATTWWWTTAPSITGSWSSVGSTGQTYSLTPSLFCISLPTTNASQRVQLQWY